MCWHRLVEMQRTQCVVSNSTPNIETLLSQLRSRCSMSLQLQDIALRIHDHEGMEAAATLPWCPLEDSGGEAARELGTDHMGGAHRACADAFDVAMQACQVWTLPALYACLQQIGHINTCDCRHDG